MKGKKFTAKTKMFKKISSILKKIPEFCPTGKISAFFKALY
jgi:hypothetical protein